MSGSKEMLSRKAYVVLRVVLGVFCLPAPALWAQTGQSDRGPGQEIHVTADSLKVEERGTKVEARGNVELKRQEMTLKADELRLNRETQQAEAKGKVSVDDPQWKMKAEAAQFNLEQETGTIDQGEIFLEAGHLSMSGKRLEKFSGQAYHIDEGFFTTCLCESGPPTWKVSADRIDLRREGEAILRGGTFYLMDVPVLYLPYAYFPLRTERQTGFLFPRFGSSTKEGFKFEQPFFWAISKSADATVGIDVESRARVGLFGELRAIMSRDAGAEIALSYFNEGLRKNEDRSIGDRTIADQDIPKDRWSVFATHRQSSPLGWKTYSDISAFSDDLFLRDIDTFILDSPRERELRSSRYASSRFGVVRNWNDVSLQGGWAFHQDFIQPDKHTLQKTPQILFRGRRALGETPVEFRWRAEGVNYLRREGADGLRLDLRPELFLPFQAFPYLLGSFNLALRETAYHLYQDEGSFDRNRSRQLVEVRGNMGTSVGRVYDLGASYLRKMKHVVEPEMSYLFIPGVRDRDIPIFDGTDRINRRNLLTFALTNRLWGKFAQETTAIPEDRDVELVSSANVGDVREMGRLRLALSYDIDRERKGGDSLSDLDMNFRLTPVDYLALGFDTGLNPGPWQVSQAAAVFSLLDPRPLTHRVLDRDFMRPNRLDLSYRFIRRDSLAQLADNANLTALSDERLLHRNVVGALGVNAFFHLTDRVLLLYDTSYNARDGRFTNNRGGIKILSQCECWTLSFSLKRSTNPDKTSFKFSFDLLGLGSQNKELFK
ncbi:MAG: LPS-assembly protein LptD [Deltaproteobacteria bacterium]|nr:LPS-assembly protein LptD [Deltaproteobacteria bacterium]